jgi:Family of unknown function (DUF6266)
MATLRKGLFGGFSGKLGGVVGSSWKGILVVKKLPAPRKTGPSPAQLEQQARFSQLVSFLRPVTPLLNKAFEKSNLNMSAFNKALSNNQNAVTGIYPDFKIDYSKVILCKGYIRNGDVIELVAGSEGKLILSVCKSSLYRIAAIWTLFFIAAYEQESGQWIYKMNPKLTDNQTYELDLSPFRSKSFHTYAGFMPATGASTISLYTGMITVQ